MFFRYDWNPTLFFFDDDDDDVLLYYLLYSSQLFLKFCFPAAVGG